MRSVRKLLNPIASTKDSDMTKASEASSSGSPQIGAPLSPAQVIAKEYTRTGKVSAQTLDGANELTPARAIADEFRRTGKVRAEHAGKEVKLTPAQAVIEEFRSKNEVSAKPAERKQRSLIKSLRSLSTVASREKAKRDKSSAQTNRSSPGGVKAKGKPPDVPTQ
jgi:hypothetical protein